MTLRPEDPKEPWRLIRWILGIPILFFLLLGYIAIVYSNYREDAGSPETPDNTDFGVALLLFAAFLAGTALRRHAPGRVHLALIGGAFAALLVWYFSL
jgi:hypothetical protein